MCSHSAAKRTAVITAVSDADPSQTASCTITVDDLPCLGNPGADEKVTVTDVVRLRAVIVSGGAEAMHGRSDIRIPMKTSW